MIDRDIFEDLFVLEIANNHWGSVERGLKIIEDYSRVVRFNNIRAAMKLQLRDVDHFIHRDFRGREDIRYIKKTLDTQLPKDEYARLAEAVRKSGCVPMATPFDEASVDFCVELGLPLLKLASSDINDWILIEKIAKTQKPVIVSTGGSSVKDTDDLVTFFANRNIPLAINHCVSLYPSEDRELELNQIDFLRHRYPNNTIGFSSHESHDWSASIMMAYAKGARTFERHVDIEDGTAAVSPYCSLPEQVDTWFKSWHKAREMCGIQAATKDDLREGDQVPGRARSRGLCRARAHPDPRGVDVGGCLPGDSVAEGADLLPGRLMSGEMLHQGLPPKTSRSRLT